MKEMNYLKAMDLLESYDIPIVKSSYMTKETQSAQKSAEVGFPLVMKIDCTEPIHKSDEGFVKTDITSVDELEETYTNNLTTGTYKWNITCTNTTTTTTSNTRTLNIKEEEPEEPEEPTPITPTGVPGLNPVMVMMLFLAAITIYLTKER